MRTLLPEPPASVQAFMNQNIPGTSQMPWWETDLVSEWIQERQSTVHSAIALRAGAPGRGARGGWACAAWATAVHTPPCSRRSRRPGRPRLSGQAVRRSRHPLDGGDGRGGRDLQVSMEKKSRPLHIPFVSCPEAVAAHTYQSVVPPREGGEGGEAHRGRRCKRGRPPGGRRRSARS